MKMRLYAGSSKQFITDAVHNQISEKLKNAFFANFRYLPSQAELNSWRNSLKAISLVFQDADLMDHGVILEYQLPMTSKRLDCLIAGRDESDRDNAVIIELKQWERCDQTEGDNEVLTWVGGAQREVLHPSAQVGQYKMYLEDMHTAFYQGENPITLNACTYLHNYYLQEDDMLLSDKFSDILLKYPIFSADDVSFLETYLIPRLKRGMGVDVLRLIEGGQYRPSKKLMEHVGNMIKGKPEYVLLDEQLIVYDKVISCAKKGFQDRRKTIIIVKGGPGTGKSVIAINLMADLLLDEYNSLYATGSRAFTETLRKIIGPRGAIQFKYFNSFMEAEYNAVDVLICDESHRIRKTSSNRFTPKNKRSELPQIQELLDVAKVGVYFIDDHQVVRQDEIGSSSYIKQHAFKNDCVVHEYQLEAQFRCSGSDAFVNWVNNTLGIERTANVIWTGEESFEFRIIDSPEDLEDKIRQKVNQGFKARLTAGFCWKWSHQMPDGTLNEDVTIGDYKRPWNARPEAKKLAKGIPKATLWAYDPNGIDQIGCVYTAQGFEFDYIGVIFGDDLKYNFNAQRWDGFPENSADSVVRKSKYNFVNLIKNTYRILLSRGLKGCYVFFIDKDTERFFKSRMEIKEDDHEEKIPKEPEIIPFVNALPLYELRSVANYSFGDVVGYFSEDEDFKYKRIQGGPFPEDLFLVKAEGDSMEPKIPDGSICLFKKYKGGSRNGKIVLCKIPEYSGGASIAIIKKYQSFRIGDSDSIGETKKIILSSINPDHLAIEIVEGEEFETIGIFVRVVEKQK